MKDEQIAFFQTFGVLLFRQAFSPQEIRAITEETDALWRAHLKDDPDAPDIHLAPFIELNTTLARLVEDDRIHGPVARLLGDDFIWSGSEGSWLRRVQNDAHHWHADRPGPRELVYPRIKIMLYLDPMKKDAGAFRVIPGSHRSPLHEALADFQRSHSESNPTFFGLHGSDVPCYALESEPGDVVLFHHSLFHAVYAKQPGRRYIALKFATRPTTDEHLASMQKYAGEAFTPAESFANSDSPRIRAMVSGLRELGERARKLKVLADA